MTVFFRSRPALRALLVAALAVACAPASAPPAPGPASAGPAATGELPLKHAPQPTVAAITPGDLMTRLYVIADDSMLGREAGTIGNVRATTYIAAEAQRIGLQPAGENGGYFQTIPMVTLGLDPASALNVGGEPLAPGSEYAVFPPISFFPFGSRFSGSGVEVVYGGRLGDTAAMLAPAKARGKAVLLLPAQGPGGEADFQVWTQAGLDRYPDAALVAVASLDATPPQVLAFFGRSQERLADGEEPGGSAPLGIIVSAAAAERMLGKPLAGAAPGATGARVSGSVRFAEAPVAHPARNVVAILPGSDPALRGEYVAIGAHNDHIGTASRSLDHDSLRAFNRVMRPEGAEDQPGEPTPAQAAQIAAELARLRALHPAAREDSINNGADDDGSGTVTVLEIAQALAAMPRKPKRSLLFVWHTAEEKGLFGSEYFTDHPTVPRDSIVAQLNMDMVGRGGPDDLARGGPAYLQLVGSRRLSSELGDLVERVNRDGNHGFDFDYQYDAEGHPQNIYCRSDHYSYARFGIPVTFFTTGVHRDYHMETDEPQYIDYEHMAAVASLIEDVAVHVANLDHRLMVNRPIPDRDARCQQ